MTSKPEPEPSEVRATLDSRYDDLKSGRVKPIDGEEAFARLLRRKTLAAIREGWASAERGELEPAEQVYAAILRERE